MARTIDFVRRNRIALLAQDIARLIQDGTCTRPMVMLAAKQACDMAEADNALKQNKPRDVVIQMQPAVAASDAPAGEEAP